MDPEKLVDEAVKATVGALVKEAAGPALAAGKRVLAWLKAKLGGEKAAVVAAVEAEPTKTSAKLGLSAAVSELLEKQPELAADLDRVLKESGYREAAVQTVTTTGIGNTTAQTAGQGNTVTIGNPRSAG